MPEFRYKAVGAAGEILEGRLDAPDDRSVAERLRQDGRVPIKIEPAVASFWRTEIPIGLRRSKRISDRRLARLCLDLATLLRAGVTIDRAIEIQKGASDDRSTQDLLSDVHDGVRGGRSLSDALETLSEAFPSTLMLVVRAAERGGQLEAALDRFGHDLEAANSLRKRVASSLIYPAFLVVLVVVSLILVVTVVIPQFQPLFEQAGAELPATTRAIMATSEFLQGYWWALALGLIAAIAGVRLVLSDLRARRWWDENALALPLIGRLIKKIHAAQGSRLMAMMLKNGVPAIEALDLAKNAESNLFAQEAYQQVIDHVRTGRRLGEAFGRHPLYEGMAAELITVGEHSGTVDETFARIAVYYGETAMETLERLVALLSPALTILLGLTVAFVIASVLLALLSVNQLVI